MLDDLGDSSASIWTTGMGSMVRAFSMKRPTETGHYSNYSLSVAVESPPRSVTRRNAQQI